MNLKARYEGAYAVAGTLNTAGRTIKILGFIGAAVIVAGSFAVARETIALLGVLGLVVGAIVALTSYGLGVLVGIRDPPPRAR